MISIEIRKCAASPSRSHQAIAIGGSVGAQQHQHRAQHFAHYEKTHAINPYPGGPL